MTTNQHFRLRLLLTTLTLFYGFLCTPCISSVYATPTYANHYSIYRNMYTISTCTMLLNNASNTIASVADSNHQGESPQRNCSPQYRALMQHCSNTNLQTRSVCSPIIKLHQNHTSHAANQKGNYIDCNPQINTKSTSSHLQTQSRHPLLQQTTREHKEAEAYRQPAKTQPQPRQKRLSHAQTTPSRSTSGWHTCRKSGRPNQPCNTNKRKHQSDTMRRETTHISRNHNSQTKNTKPHQDSQALHPLPKQSTHEPTAKGVRRQTTTQSQAALRSPPGKSPQTHKSLHRRDYNTSTQRMSMRNTCKRKEEGEDSMHAQQICWKPSHQRTNQAGGENKAASKKLHPKRQTRMMRTQPYHKRQHRSNSTTTATTKINQIRHTTPIPTTRQLSPRGDSGRYRTKKCQD